MDKTFRRFEAWKSCHELVLRTYAVTANFPPDEKFGLTSQARRAAFSAAANIAEGSAKRGSKEFRRYLDISNGSLSELSYTLLLAHDLGLINKKDYNGIEKLKNRASYQTWKLYDSLNPNPPSP